MSPYRDDPASAPRAASRRGRVFRVAGAGAATALCSGLAFVLVRNCTAPNAPPSRSRATDASALVEMDVPAAFDSGAALTVAPSPLPEAPAAPVYTPPTASALIDALRTAIRVWLSPEARAVLDDVDATGVRDGQLAAIVLTIVDHATRMWLPEIMNTLGYGGQPSATLQSVARHRLSSLEEVHDIRSLAAAIRAIRAAGEATNHELQSLDDTALVAGENNAYEAVDGFADVTLNLAQSAQLLLEALPASRRRMQTMQAQPDASVAVDAGTLSHFAERLATLEPTRPDHSARAFLADDASTTATPDALFVRHVSDLLDRFAWMTWHATHLVPVRRDGQIVALALLDELVTLARPAPVVHRDE